MALSKLKLRDLGYGEVRITLRDPVGRETVVLDWSRNAFNSGYADLLVDRELDSSVPGIAYLAVGVGPVPESYDISDPPEAVTYSYLVGELDRVEIAYRNCVDSEGALTTERTRTVEYTAIFENADAVGTISEIGLFGGRGSDTANGGWLVNYKGITPFVKPNDQIMVIAWRLVYTL